MPAVSIKASSLESRVPLLDHRITDLVASMPPALKFRGGEPPKQHLPEYCRHIEPKPPFRLRAPSSTSHRPRPHGTRIAAMRSLR